MIATPSKRVSLPLQNIRIASPCPARWSEMDGDAHKRFCHQCSKHVYDLAGLSEAEIYDLLNTGHACVRLYRRHDGTILTADCPVGLRLARTRAGRIVLYTAALSLALLAAGLTAVAGVATLNGSEAFAQTPAMQALQRAVGRLTPPHYILGGAVL